MGSETTIAARRDDAAGAQAIPNRLDTGLTWLLRVAVALFFVTAGYSKFRDPMWGRLFERIGLGQWFRSATGLIEIGGGLLALIPRISILGVGLLACTMGGAVLAWMTVLHAPANAPIPGAIFVALLAIGFRQYGQAR